MTTPTVDYMLDLTLICNGYHEWPVYGGTIVVKEDTLREALEDAYDQHMPSWPEFVDLNFQD